MRPCRVGVPWTGKLAETNVLLERSFIFGLGSTVLFCFSIRPLLIPLCAFGLQSICFQGGIIFRYIFQQLQSYIYMYIL